MGLGFKHQKVKQLQDVVLPTSVPYSKSFLRRFTRSCCRLVVAWPSKKLSLDHFPSYGKTPGQLLSYGKIPNLICDDLWWGNDDRGLPAHWQIHTNPWHFVMLCHCFDFWLKIPYMMTSPQPLSLRNKYPWDIGYLAPDCKQVNQPVKHLLLFLLDLKVLRYLRQPLSWCGCTQQPNLKQKNMVTL